MNFGLAIESLKRGQKVSRAGWNGRGMWIALSVPDLDSTPSSALRGAVMSLPYIYMKTVQGDLVPWLASQTDVLAEDWEILP